MFTKCGSKLRVCTGDVRLPNPIQEQLTVPPELIQFLTAKSTKKESTKFTTKLSALLNWVGEDEQRQELAGIKSVGQNEIWIKKAVLASTFQIQYDSLMMNLKRNGFRLVKNMREWALYDSPENFQTSSVMKNTPKSAGPRAVLRCAPQVPAQTFMSQARDRWLMLTQGKDLKLIHAETFYESVIDQFGVKSLKRSEMLYMLSRVMFPRLPGFISFQDFVQLFANFGEKSSIFPKLVLLFRAATATDDSWLVFECVEVPPKHPVHTTVHFFGGSSYGFIVSFPNGTTRHIRNDIDLPFFSEYLVDNMGNRYSSWQSALSL